MKFKFINARVAAISCALMIIGAEPSQAASIVLNGGANNLCTYTALSANASGDISVTCAINTTPTTVPVCNPTATVNPVASGGATTLNANCTNLPISSYAWSTIDPAINC